VAKTRGQQTLQGDNQTEEDCMEIWARMKKLTTKEAGVEEEAEAHTLAWQKNQIDRLQFAHIHYLAELEQAKYLIAAAHYALELRKARENAMATPDMVDRWNAELVNLHGKNIIKTGGLQNARLNFQRHEANLKT